MEQFEKTPYEEFVIEGLFSRVLKNGETVTNATVTAVDKDGSNATDSVVQESSAVANNQSIFVGVKGGTIGLEPYIITMKAEDSAGNKWQLDIEMNIKSTSS